MTSSKVNPHGIPTAVPHGRTQQSRFIPREELVEFAAWRPGSFGGAASQSPHPAGRATTEQSVPPPSEPAQPSEADWLDIVQNARDGGYQDGYRDGQVALEAFKESFAKQMAAQIGQLLSSLDAQWNTLEGDMAVALTRTAVQLARQVVRHELETKPEIVAKVAQEAVGAIVLSARHLRVHVHPSDHPLVAAGAGEALKARDARLVIDPLMEPGGCVVESDLGRVDARIGTRWAQAAAVYGRDDAWDAPDLGVTLSDDRGDEPVEGGET